MLSMFLFTKVLLALSSFLIFFVAMFIVLRLFDWLLGVSFKSSFSLMNKCPTSLAIYFGLRWLGTSISMGVIVCLAYIF